MSSLGRQIYTDGVSVIDCQCGTVDGSEVITQILVPSEACVSKKACREPGAGVCLSGFRCCSSNIAEYAKGAGPCVGQEFIVQPESPLPQ